MTPSAARSAFPWLVVVGILVAALTLRSPIVAPTPVLRDISANLGIDAGTAGPITTAPALIAALMTPVAALLIRRSGTEAALMTTLVGVVVGSFFRAPPVRLALGRMIVIGAAIRIGNVMVPVVIRREVPPRRVATVTAAHTAAINVGSLVASLATAPLAARRLERGDPDVDRPRARSGGTWSAALSVLVGTTSVFAVSLIAATLLLRRGR